MTWGFQSPKFNLESNLKKAKKKSKHNVMEVSVDEEGGCFWEIRKEEKKKQHAGSKKEGEGGGWATLYLGGEELLAYRNCCCTASATATLCFAFIHSLPPSHTHLLTHALSISVSFNPSTLCPSQQPPLSLCLNLFPVFPSPFLFLLHVASVSSRLLFSVSASHHL